ncbi:MAG: DUF4838 domain-containing protein, partial [Victivallales bacterium]|nr:DUF4838 domain-containing protein [Victivallales bacterium]
GISARPNVLVRVAQLGTEWTGSYRQSLRSLHHQDNAKALAELNAWSKVATVSIWDYWITYRGAAPGLCLSAIDDNLPIYKEKGIESFFVEHEYPMENLFYPLRAWVGFRKINRTDENLGELTRKFLNGYYGEKAAPYMAAILGRMQEEQEKVAGDLCKLSAWARPDLSKRNFDFYDEQIAKALAAAENDDCRKHVIKERLAIDHAKLKILKGAAAADMKPFLARMLDDCNLLTADWGGSGIPNTVKMYEDIGVDIPMPAEIDGYKVIHQITWKDALDYVPLRVPCSDPDAAGGHAIKADDKETGYSGFCFGYYIENAEKFVQEINNFPKEKIPQDEKYHYYKVGKVTLEESGYFHSHTSWTAQWFTDHLIVPGGDNDYIAYISLKAVGPNYVKGSKQSSAIWSDRVLLVREK